jgi:hypothetical protein
MSDLGDIGSAGATGAGIGTSVMPGLGTVIGGAIGIVGGTLGKMFSGDDQLKATQAVQDAIREMEMTGLPPDLSKPLLLEKFKQVGLYSPQLEQQMDMAFSKVAGIQEDPSLRKAQTEALQRLGGLSKTGMGPQDLAKLLQVQQNIASDTEGKRQQIMQNMQSRGQAGSGGELASALLSAQGGGNRLANEQLQVNSDASARALSALSGYLSGTSGLRAQDFNVESTKAQADDELTKFNLNNSINRQMRNVSAQNQAQQQNLNTQQAVHNANTSQANEEARRQSKAQEDYWNNVLKQKKLIADAKNAEAGYYQGQADQTKKSAGDIAGGVADIATGYLDANAKEKARLVAEARQDQLRAQDYERQRKLALLNRPVAPITSNSLAQSSTVPSSLSSYSFYPA